MNQQPLLSVNSLSKVYENGVQALKNVSFEVKKGEFLGIIGLSGSGKSTLLRCINRLVEPSRGSIRFDGQDLVPLPKRKLRDYRRKIGMVFQHFNLIDRRSVLVNVMSGNLASMSTTRSLTGLFSDEERELARNYLRVVGLEEKERVRADELSGGQKQRVAIARSLMQDPEILLADEPVASLDPATSHSVMDYLRDANQKLGKTILCNLHFLSLVREYTTRVIALKDGEMVYEGSPKEINENWFKEIYGEQAREIEVH